MRALRTLAIVALGYASSSSIDGPAFAQEAGSPSLARTSPFVGEQDAAAEGERLYGSLPCVSCHGRYGEGAMGPPLERAQWRYGGTDADLYTSIAAGRPGGMPGWASRLTEEQIWKLVEYLRLLQ